MITIIYKCDCCGHEQSKSEQMWVMKVTVQEKRQDYNYQYTAVMKEQLWCRVCVEKVNLLPVMKVKQEEVKEVTLEELIRKIVREEIQES